MPQDIDIIPTEAPKLPKWLNFVFYFFLIFLVVSIVGLFVLNGFVKKYQAGLEELEAALSQEPGISDSVLEKEVLDAKNKIDDFSFLANQRKEVSGVFSIIESICHPKVWFSDFQFDPAQGEANLKGETENFETLGQQILILKNDERLENFELGGISIAKEGKIDFELKLIVKPESLISNE